MKQNSGTQPSMLYCLTHPSVEVSTLCMWTPHPRSHHYRLKYSQRKIMSGLNMYRFFSFHRIKTYFILSFVCVMHVAVAHRSQKPVSDPLELEL